MSINNGDQSVMDCNLMNEEQRNKIEDDYGTPVSKQEELMFWFISSASCIILLVAIIFMITHRHNLLENMRYLLNTN